MTDVQWAVWELLQVFTAAGSPGHTSFNVFTFLLLIMTCDHSLQMRLVYRSSAAQAAVEMLLLLMRGGERERQRERASTVLNATFYKSCLTLINVVFLSWATRGSIWREAVWRWIKKLHVNMRRGCQTVHLHCQDFHYSGLNVCSQP